MPIYEYHCGKCGDFEVMQKMSDKPLTSCPTCRRKVSKLISSTTFHLKGSGWYITDYARKDKGGAKGADTKSESASTSSDTDGASTASAKSESTAKKSGKKAEKAVA